MSVGRRKVVLVGLVWHRASDPRVPLGQASIEAALRSDPNIEVASLSFPVVGSSATSVADRVLEEAGQGADIALGAYVWNERLLKSLLVELRRRGFSGRIVLGGPQVSYAGGGLELLYPQVDVFVRGYAERALCDLYRGVRPTVIPGVHVAGQLDMRTVAEAPLDQLPSPYLTDCQPLVFEEGAPRNFVRWETQRGCRYRCSFCQHRHAGSRAPTTPFHLRRLGAEARAFVAAGVNAIAVLDPIFNNGRRALDVLGVLKDAGYVGHLSLQCRFEGLDQPFLDAIGGLDVTVELGLQTIHLAEGRAVNRFNKRETVEQGLAALRDRRIDHEVSLIYGLPNQTLASFRETVDWCLRRGIPRLKAFPLMLLRGTPLERERARWGLVENRDEIPAVVASSTFSEDDHRQMARISAALVETEDTHPASIEALDGVCVEPFRSSREVA